MRWILRGALLAAAACGGSGVGTSTSGGAGNGSLSSSSSASGGPATSSASLGSATSSTGGTSGGTLSSSTSGSGSSTSGYVSGATAWCNGSFAYVNNACVAVSCVGQGNSTFSGIIPCALADGGLGVCDDGACQGADFSDDPNNCRSYGLVCPTDTVCTRNGCTRGDGGLGSACDAGACASDRSCQNGLCILQDCPPGSDSQVCGDINTATDDGGEVCCGGACINVLNDSNNCRGCGLMCATGEICVSGDCLPTSCATAEPGSFCAAFGGTGHCCQGVCTNLNADDPANCGGCGIACPDGGACLGGSCTRLCEGDPDCASGSTCSKGGCVAATCAGAADGEACATGVCCGQVCTNTQTDPLSCGGCGLACPPNRGCESGTCMSDLPATCAGVQNGFPCETSGVSGTCCASTCTPPDDDNCGNCGFGCPTGSHCALDAPSGQYACLTGTPGVSATCDAGCASGEGCASVSGRAVECLPTTCDAAHDNTFCALGDGGYGECCGTSCANLDDDAANCSECGNVCPLGEICRGQTCVSADAGTPGNCHANGCPSGTVCLSNGLCVSASCSQAGTGSLCAFGGSKAGICCGDSCVDGDQDPANCGRCGWSCESGVCLGADCVSGIQTCQFPYAPVSEPTGFLSATGYCGEPYCTRSGAECASSDGNTGVCCDADVCADLGSDPFNCGGCGSACGPGQTCTFGVCSGVAPPCDASGKLGAYCNLDAGPGWLCCPVVGCTDTSADPANCGSCGAVCDGGCANGSCS